MKDERRKFRTGPQRKEGESPRRMRLKQLAYGSIAVLLASGVFVMIYLFMSTTDGADRLALRNERALVTEALKHSLDLEARHLTFVAVNDKTVREVQADDRIDPEFAREIASQMWLDFQFDWTLIVDSRNTPVLVAAEDEVVPAAAGREIVEITRDLVARARLGYQAVRRPSRDGYKVRYVEKGTLAPIYATDLRVIAGRPALISAMAIVPQSADMSLPDGPPGVIVAVTLAGESFLAETGATLLLKDFRYIPGAERHTASVPVPLQGHRQAGSFVWTTDAPGTRIREAIGPIALLLVAGFVSLGIMFARKLARKSKALEESEALNRRMATHDSMTGLANRAHFQEVFDLAITDCHTCPCTVLAIDLDCFKQVNDTWGHDAGDMVLRQVAHRLRTVLSEHALIARTGGDEFMALITGEIADDRIGWLCDAVIEAVSRPIPVSGGLAEIGVSIGWASAPRHADTASHLLGLVDQALYYSKHNGRGRAAGIEDAVSHPHAEHSRLGAEENHPSWKRPALA